VAYLQVHPYWWERLTDWHKDAYRHRMAEKYVRSIQVMWNMVDDEAVLLNTTTGKYFGMNKTAMALWRFIETPRSIQEIVKELLNFFEVEESLLAKDVEALLSILESKHLIVKV